VGAAVGFFQLERDLDRGREAVDIERARIEPATSAVKAADGSPASGS
jgi:hypothetical protein